jgi:hypothetical protein
MGRLAALVGLAALWWAHAQVTITTLAGTGTAGYTRDGPATSFAVHTPSAAAFNSSSGELFFSETNNHIVRKRTAAGQIVTVAGVPGVSGNNGTTGNALQLRLFDPFGLCFASNGDLLISDGSNHFVRRLAADGTMSVFAGNGDASSAHANGAATLVPVYAPYSCSLEASGSVLIGEYSGCRVDRVSSAGQLTRVLGTGTCAVTPTASLSAGMTLSNVVGVASDSAGSFFITEHDVHRVLRVAAGGAVSLFAGTGTAASTGDGNSATSATLNRPYGLAYDNVRAVLHVSERAGHRIRSITGGNILTLAGTGTQGSTETADNLAVRATFNAPYGLTVDSMTGDVYVAGSNGHRVQKLAMVSTAAGRV